LRLRKGGVDAVREGHAGPRGGHGHVQAALRARRARCAAAACCARMKSRTCG
jgi:hypothetical protein